MIDQQYIEPSYAVVPGQPGFYVVKRRDRLVNRQSQQYRLDDAIALADWLDWRAAGYP